MLGWALRILLLWVAIGFAGYYGWENRAKLVAEIGRQDAERPALPQHSAQRTVPNSMSYRAGPSGHVMLEADVNGSPVKFMLDTGASFVTLTPEAAEAAGLEGGNLRFTERLSTANGIVRVAPVRLREVRLGQLTMEDVDAVVVETAMPVSLLGMSFLKRLESYEMRDGAFVINW